MRSALYRKNVLNHLSNYKNSFLGITTNGTFRGSSIYGHILPKPAGTNPIPVLNLLPTINVYETSLQQQNIKYHQFAHHLNSSQLMCINFFLPIINDNILLEFIRKATNINICNTAKIEEATFEKVFENKDNTNFDFYLKLTTGEEIFFEIKYTEQEFGGNCFVNGVLKPKYVNKYNNYYVAQVENSIMGPVSMDDFCTDYQINRSISYIDSPKKYVIFILPFDSDDIFNELTAVTNRYPNHANQVKVVDWTNLSNIALLETQNNLLHQHYRLFKEKYII